MLGALTGAPQLTLVALVPVFALLALRHVQGSLSDRRLVVAMTAALTAQIYISTEVLATAVLFGGLTLLAAYLLAPERRPALRRTIGLLAVALGAAAVLAAPLLYYVLFRSRTLPEHALTEFPADLLSFAVPTRLVALSPDRFGASIPSWAAGSTYFGVPLLGLIAAFAWTYRGRLGARLSVVAFGVAALAALGSALHVAGTKTALPLPWRAFAELPFLRYAIPLRFSAFAFLAAAVIVGLWLSWRPSVARWAVFGLVAVSLVPTVGSALWHVKIGDPPFFSTDLHERFLGPDDRVLTIPTSGRNMRWQARADFAFRMAAGYVGQDPRGYTRFPVWRKLVAASTYPGAARGAAGWRDELVRFVEAKGVTVILADRASPAPLRRLFASLARPVEVGGVVLYRVAPAGSASAVSRPTTRETR
jgi:hypothetical protein